MKTSFRNIGILLLLLFSFTGVYAQSVYLTVVSQSLGQTWSPNAGNPVYNKTYIYHGVDGEEISVQGIPLAGAKVRWDCSDTYKDKSNVKINQRIDQSIGLKLQTGVDYYLTIIFEPTSEVTFSLELNVDPGATVGSIAVIDCNPSTVNKDTLNLSRIPVNVSVTVQVVPVPNSGWSFSHWETIPDGKVTNASSTIVDFLLDRDIKATAVFTKDSQLLRVTANPVGLGGTVSNGGYYEPDSGATLKAIPNAGFNFKKWVVLSGSGPVEFLGADTDQTAQVTLKSGGSNGWRIEGQFEPVLATNQLYVGATEGGTVKAISPAKGMVTVLGGESKNVPCVTGEDVNLVATATAGYLFNGWEGPVTNSGSNATKVRVTAGTVVRAVFTPISYNFTVAAKTDGGSSSVGTSKLEGNGNGDIVSTIGVSRKTFPKDTVITLTATPQRPGYYFKGWEGTNVKWESSPALDQLTPPATGISSTAVSTNVIMGDRPGTATAVFIKEPARYNLTLQAEAGGTARATGSYVNLLTGVTVTINETVSGAGSTVLYSIPEGTVITVEAAEDSSGNYQFNQWNVSPSANFSLTGLKVGKVTLNSDTTAIAKFNRTNANLTITIAPPEAFSEGAQVTVNGTAGVTNSSTTNHSTSSSPTVKAVNSGQWIFQKWIGAPVDASTANPVSVGMSQDRSITASFVRQNLVSITATTGGTAKVLDPITSVLGTSANFLTNASATVLATPIHGYFFTGFTTNRGDTTVTGTPDGSDYRGTFTVKGDTEVVANFAKGIQVNVYAHTSNNAIGGTLIPTSNDKNNMWVSGVSFGTTVKISAADTSGYMQPGITISLSAPSTAEYNNPAWRFEEWQAAVGGGTFAVICTTPNGSYTLPSADAVSIRPVYTNSRNLKARVYVDAVEKVSASPDTPAVSYDSATLVLGGADNKVQYDNASRSLVAGAKAGLVFRTWSGAATGLAANAATNTLEMSADKTIAANYKTIVSLTTGLATIPAGNPDGLALGSLVTLQNVSTGQSLTLSGNPSTNEFGKADTFRLVATPTVTVGLASYRFAGWDINNNGVVDPGEPTSATYTTTINADTTVNAIYIRQYTLTLRSEADSADITGSTTFSPVSGLKYDHGAEVTLTASASGYDFQNWTTNPSAAQTSPGKVTMTSDVTATAHFSRGGSLLTVNFQINDAYNPASPPVGINVTVRGSAAAADKVLFPPTILTQQYLLGDTASLEASCPADYVFEGWNSPITPDGSDVLKGTVLINSSKSTTATFKQLHNVRVQSKVLPSGAVHGCSVVASGYQSDEGGGAYKYKHGVSGQYTAVPSTGFRFIRWEVDTNGDDIADFTGGGNPLSYPVRENQTITAVFAEEYQVTFLTNPANGSGGSINPAGVQTCYYGQIVNLSATPNIAADWSFSSWTAPGVSLYSGNAESPIGTSLNGTTSSAPASGIVITGAHVITANFSRAGAEQILTVHLKVDGVLYTSPAGCPALIVKAKGSTVPPSTPLDEVELSAGGQKVYYRGDTVGLDANVLAALADTYAFVAWESAGTSPVWNFTMPPADKTVVAIYKTRAKLTMAVSPIGVGVTTPSVGTHDVLLNDNVTLTARPDDAYIDNKIFDHWTADVGAVPSPDNVTPSSVIVDATAKTVTAHFVDGYKLNVRVRYEDTAKTSDAISWSAPIEGSRTARASCPGGSAGIYSSNPQIIDYSMQTIRIGEAASIVAIPNTPGYEFIGWANDNSTTPIVASTTHVVTMSSPQTWTALFKRVRVKLEVYTIPAGNPDVRGEASGDYKLISGPEPRVYEVFYGARPTLVASSDDSRYGFVAWFKGNGYSSNSMLRFSETATVVYPEALTQDVTQVTAYFLPYGLHRLILFTEPQSEIDIHHVNVPGAVYQTYTFVDGRPACVADVGVNDPYSEVPIHADGGATGLISNQSYGFLRWISYPGFEECIQWVKELYRNDTTVNFPIGREVRLVALYALPGGYALNLKLALADTDLVVMDRYRNNFFNTDLFGDLLGNVKGNTIDTYTGHPILYVNRSIRHSLAIFGPGHIETFDTDALFQSGPFSLIRWTYEKGSDPIVTSEDPTFTTTPGISGTSETVTAYVDVAMHTVSINQPVVRQPVGWTAPSVTSGGDFSFYDYDTTGFPADIFLPIEVDPAPAPYLKQSKRVKNGSAPVLIATGVPAGFRFAGWDTNADQVAEFSASSFTWNAWPSESVWPRKMTEDRVVAPIYIKQLPVTLTIVPVGSLSTDQAWLTAPLSVGGGIEVKAVDNILTGTKTYDYGARYTVTARPQQYHVVEKWVIEKATADGGAVFDAPIEIMGDGTPGDKTYDVTLDYPTKVTVYFALQQFSLTVQAEDGGAHGKIKLNGLPVAGSATESGSFGYGTSQAIEAIPDEGYEFVGWTTSAGANAATPSDRATTVFVDTNKVLTAHFKRKVKLTMATDPVNVGIDYPNIISPAVGVYDQIEGRQLVDGSLVAIRAESGNAEEYDFVKWLIEDDATRGALPPDPRSLSGKQNNLVLNGDTTATAVYAKLHYLTLEVTPAPFAETSKAVASPNALGNTTLTAVANGLASVVGRFRATDNVVVTAIPGTNFEFDYWEISGVSPNPTTATYTIGQISTNISAKAFFKPKKYTITVAPYSADPAPSPGASIASSLTGQYDAVTHDFLSVGGSSVQVEYGKSISLSTAAAALYEFVNWSESGQAATVSVPHVITVSGNRTLQANFKRSRYKLTTQVDPVGDGSISVSGDTRDGTPTSTHAVGTVLTLAAVDNSNTVFTHWSGDVSANTSQRQQVITMNKDRVATAHFGKAVRIKISTNDPVYGTVSIGNNWRKQDGEYYVFAEGDPVTITASPTSSHYLFDGWAFSPATPDGISDSTQSSITFTAKDDVNATGNFSRRNYKLIVTATKDGVPIAANTVATKLILEEGSLNCHDFLLSDNVSRLYDPSAVPIKAEAVVIEGTGPRFRFAEWVDTTLGTRSTANPLMFAFSRDARIEANFLRQVRITVNGAKDITYGEPGTNISATISPIGTHDYDIKASLPKVVTITATAPTGYEFVGWSGDTSKATSKVIEDDLSKGTLTFDISDSLADSGDLALTPQFRKKHFPIKVVAWDKASELEGVGGSVRVTPNPEINGEYYYGTELTAKVTSVSSGYRFVGWDINGDHLVDLEAQSQGTSYVFTVSEAKTIYAIFIKVHVLTLVTNPEDGSWGTAEVLSPAPRVLGGGMYEFDYGVNVQIKAEELNSATFKNWIGMVAEGTTASLNTSVMMDRDQWVQAVFEKKEKVTLTASANPVAGGDVSINGSVVPSGTSQIFGLNDTVDLGALPKPGYKFSGWTPAADVTINNPNIPSTGVVMSRNKSIAANFEEYKYKLTIEKQPAAGGTVTGEGLYTYSGGVPAEVTVTATPSPGYVFVGWRLDSSAPITTGTSATVTMDRDRTIYALFKQEGTYAVFVTFSPAGSGTSRVLAYPGYGPSVKQITVRPNSGSGYSFGSPIWGGSDSGDLFGFEDSGTSKVAYIDALDADKYIVITMKKSQVALATSVLPADSSRFSVQVSPGPTGGLFSKGDIVRLKAISTDPNWEFAYWNSGFDLPSGSGDDTTITLDDNKEVQAVFRIKPREYKVTLGFETGSLAAANDWLKLESSAALQRGVFGSPLPAPLSGNFMENTEVSISFGNTDPDNYGFSKWTRISSLNLRGQSASTVGGSAKIWVDQNLGPRAFFDSRKKVLITEAETEGEAKLSTDALSTSPGGSVEVIGIVESDVTEVLVRAYPREGYKIERWSDPETRYAGTSLIVDRDTTDAKAWVKLSLGDRITSIKVIFKSNSAPDNKKPTHVWVEHSSELKTIDSDKNKGPGHFIQSNK